MLKLKMNAKAENSKKSTPVQTKSSALSKIRSILAFLLASLAIFFASLAILSHWTEKTLTDTDNFNAVVGPLAKNPEIQKFASQKLSQTITEQVSSAELAQSLLGSVPPNVDSAAIKAQVNQKLETEINKIITSEKFSELWSDATSSAHRQAIGLMSSPDDQPVTVISYRESLDRLLAILKTSELKQLGDIDLEQGSGEIKVKSENIKELKQNYQRLTSIDTTALILALLFGGLAILTANKRVKMVRKLGLGLAISTGLIAIFGLVLSNASLGDSNTTEILAGQAVLKSLLDELVKTALVVSIVSIFIVIGSTVFLHRGKAIAKSA